MRYQPVKRHALVVGSGVIGVSTAFELLRSNMRVTLLDANLDAGLGTSRANGALLTPSMADPWNAPGVHRHLIRSLADRNVAILLVSDELSELIGLSDTILVMRKGKVSARVSRSEQPTEEALIRYML